MEFKGTKGKWRCVIPEGYGKSTLVMNSTDIICDMVKFEGKRYNALLISKAPEMLEFHQSELKTLLNLQQTMYDREVSTSIIQEIERMIFHKEKLIKQATEL